MPKNDNAHSLRLIQSLRENVGEEAAREFEVKYPLSKSADVGKKFAWAEAVCGALEERFDEMTIRRVRMDCRCNDGKAIAEKLRTYLNRADTLQDFVEDFNAHETFASLAYISENELHFCYPECYCACVKRVPGTLYRTWCLCTLGNARGIFRELFQKEVEVELLESIKSGGEKCEIRVNW